MTQTTYPCTEPTNELKATKAQTIYDTLRHTRPRTRQDLKNYVKVFLGIDVPDHPFCPNHHTPLDYLWHTFAIDFAGCPVPFSGEKGTGGAVEKVKP